MGLVLSSGSPQLSVRVTLCPLITLIVLLSTLTLGTIAGIPGIDKLYHMVNNYSSFILNSHIYCTYIYYEQFSNIKYSYCYVTTLFPMRCYIMIANGGEWTKTVHYQAQTYFTTLTLVGFMFSDISISCTY